MSIGVFITALIIAIIFILFVILVLVFFGYLSYTYILKKNFSKQLGIETFKPIKELSEISKRIDGGYYLHGYEIIEGDFDGYDISENNIYIENKAIIKFGDNVTIKDKIKKINQLIKATGAFGANIYPDNTITLKKLPIGGIVFNENLSIFISNKYMPKLKHLFF